MENQKEVIEIWNKGNVRQGRSMSLLAFIVDGHPVFTGSQIAIRKKFVSDEEAESLINYVKKPLNI